MKIICTEKEKEQFIEGVSCDCNDDCPVAAMYDGTCINGSCRDCVEKRIEWAIQGDPK